MMPAEGRIVLAAPPGRVSVGRDARMRVVAEIPAGEAVLEDPLPRYETNKLRIRFTVGSWLVLTTEDRPSALHKHLMRKSESDDAERAQA
ncbi:hypothetical protein ABT301_11570 [Streptomyces sp. NPDC000987]|uniref:hypothetical protein n=1 Tax=Streptomyces sp. NPDC000987 TaxID=3154374 RepID=UPI00332F197E